MRSVLQIARTAAIAVALVASGCLKSDQTLTVYPDGSGKVHLKYTFMGMVAQMIKMGGSMGGPMGGGPGGGGPGGGMGQPGERPDPFDQLRKDFQNVYWVDLKAEDGAQGEYMLSGTGYFDDVNRIKKDGGISFKKAEAGDGYVLEMKEDLDQLRGGGDRELSPEQEQQQRMMLEQMKPMFAGFEARMKVVMPGVVKSAATFAPADGRAATFTMDEKMLLAIIDKKQEPPKEMRVISDLGDGLDEELAAFKKEMEEAKAKAKEQEAARQAEQEKRAAERKAEAERKKAERERRRAEREKKAAEGEKEKAPEGGGEEKPQDF